MEIFGFASVGICLAFLGILILVIASVFFFGRYLQRSSGMEKLAQRFPAGDPPSGLSGNSFTWRTVRVGLVRYRNASRIVACQAGLYIGIHVPLQRPVAALVPWNEIHPMGSTILYLRKAIECSISSPEIARLAIAEDVFDDIQEYRKKP